MNPSENQTPAGDQNKLPTEFLWNTHQYLNEYIRFADAKAFGVVAMNVAILGGLMSVNVGHLVQTAEWTFSPDWKFTAGVVCALCAIGLLVASLLFCIMVVIPRLTPKSVRHLVFWDGVLSYPSPSDYHEAVMSNSEAALNRAVGEHIHQLSTVASKKFYAIRQAIVLAAVGGVLSVITLVFVL